MFYQLRQGMHIQEHNKTHYGENVNVKICDLPTKGEGEYYAEIVSYVYILNFTDRVKIGSTVDPKNRLTRLKKSYKENRSRWNLNRDLDEFEVVALFEFPCSCSGQIELDSQFLLNDYRIFSEWFNVDVPTAVLAVEKVCDYYKIPRGRVI